MQIAHHKTLNISKETLKRNNLKTHISGKTVKINIFSSQDEDDENLEEAPLTEKPVEPTTGSTGSTKSPTRRSAPEAQRQNSVKPLADDKVSRVPSCVAHLCSPLNN